VHDGDIGSGTTWLDVSSTVPDIDPVTACADALPAGSTASATATAITLK
jgi:hypothetical protein